jgi:hypothetical protein
MKKSYSKIRHIQETNLKLEQRRFNQLLISEQDNFKFQDGKIDDPVSDVDPVQYLKSKLGYKVEDTRKITGFSTLYDGNTTDNSKKVISIYHPIDASGEYYISVRKNGVEKKFDGGKMGFGKNLFDEVINYVRI